MERPSRPRFSRRYIDGPIKARPNAARPVAVPLPAVETSHQPPAEPPAKSKKPRKLAWRFSKAQLLLAELMLMLVLIGGGGFYLIKNHSDSSDKQQNSTLPSGYFPASLNGGNVNIAVYYPVNLPVGYNVSDFKILQKNVLYYIVTDPKDEKFYITIQPLPNNFDFNGFNKKFIQPDQYNTPIGSDTVGLVGSSLIGSVQTSQNTWIILNANSSASIPNMETVTRAMRQVQL